MANQTRTLYKLTTQDNKTRKGEFNETLWGPGVTHEPKELGIPVLCSPTVIHAYEHPLIAVFMNSRHANLLDPKLWMCKGEPVVFEADLKCGCSSLTTCQEIPLPGITTDQYAQIARSAAEWAAEYAAEAAAEAAEAAEAAAEAAAKRAAEWAKWAAEWAAEAAAEAASKCANKPFSLLEILLKVISE